MTERDDSMDDDPARDGLEHLQHAATELIAAARSFLDAAEHLVADPTAVRDAFSALGAVASFASRAAASAAGMARAGPDDAREFRDGKSRLEHIDVD
jgi:hypothetical protein